MIIIIKIEVDINKEKPLFITFSFKKRNLSNKKNFISNNIKINND